LTITPFVSSCATRLAGAFGHLGEQPQINQK
jgi:hypothetical protein